MRTRIHTMKRAARAIADKARAMAPLQEDFFRAEEELGKDAPLTVLLARARCRRWKPFGIHTPQQLEVHQADVRVVEAWKRVRELAPPQMATAKSK
jgi:hypothetical protein